MLLFLPLMVVSTVLALGEQGFITEAGKVFVDEVAVG